MTLSGKLVQVARPKTENSLAIGAVASARAVLGIGSDTVPSCWSRSHPRTKRRLRGRCLPKGSWSRGHERGGLSWR